MAILIGTYSYTLYIIALIIIKSSLFLTNTDMAAGLIPFLIRVKRHDLGVIICVSHVSYIFIVFFCVGSPYTDNDDDISNIFETIYATDRYQSWTKPLKYK